MGCGVLFPRDFESRFALHGRSWLFAHDEFKMYLLKGKLGEIFLSAQSFYLTLSPGTN